MWNALQETGLSADIQILAITVQESYLTAEAAMKFINETYDKRGLFLRRNRYARHLHFTIKNIY